MQQSGVIFAKGVAYAAKERGAETREVVMKKIMFIIGLCVLQCACAVQNPQPVNSESLLSFADLANEITVAYVDMSEVTEFDAIDIEPADSP